jgi:hypothetical protein
MGTEVDREAFYEWTQTDSPPATINYIVSVVAGRNSRVEAHTRSKGKYRTFIALLIGSTFFWGCEIQNRDSDKPIVLSLAGTGAVLSDAQLKYYVARADNGDGYAAYKVWAHYIIGAAEGEKGAEKGQIYFDKAVKLEYPPALYNQAVSLWNEGGADPAAVLKIAARAIELGQPDSAKLIPELKAAIEKAKLSKRE